MKNKSWLIKFIFVLFILIIAAIAIFYFQSALFNVIFNPSKLDNLESTQDFKRGPHGGRLLQANHFQVEVFICETEEVPPKFRIYFYDDGMPIKPSDVKFKMSVERINRSENIFFQIDKDYLESITEVSEPHSFKVKIHAEYQDRAYEWEYKSYEGRIELTTEAIHANAIKVEKTKSIFLEIRMNAMGKIIPNEELTVAISPRFPGVAKAVNKKLGEYVHADETLAIIESNESLRNYEIKSEISGIVIKKDINIGMSLSGQENIFVVSDLKSVWADFKIYHHDIPQIKLGKPVEVKSLDGKSREQSTIFYISPLGSESTQSVSARALLSNVDGLWKPGLFISGEITVDQLSVPVAVKTGALQTFRDWDVVFISVGNVFEVVPVKLGKRNKEWVEIISGLSPEDNYVSENSFVLKADLEKSGAKLEH